MSDSMYPAPVIPGWQGARRAPLVSRAAPAARRGEPGFLEKLIDRPVPAERGWTVEQRQATPWRAL